METQTVSEITRMQNDGQSPEDISSFSTRRRVDMSGAGYNHEEIEKEFGTPPFDAKPLIDHITQNLADATAKEAAVARTGPTPVKTMKDAILAGYGISATGLMLSGRAPEHVVTQETDRMLEILSNVTSMAVDLPLMTGAAIVGTGAMAETGPVAPIAGMGFAAAVPAMLRTILMEKYEKGEVQDFREFWSRMSGATMEFLKNFALGAGAGAAAKAAGAVVAPFVSPTVKHATMMTSATAELATVGAALEGRVPARKDFEDATIAVAGFGAAAHVAGKFRSVYQKHGIPPGDVLQDIQKDPTILPDLLSDNIDTPKTYGAKAPDTQAMKDITKRMIFEKLASGDIAEDSAFRGASKEELREIINTGELLIGENAEGEPGISAANITPEGFPIYGDGHGYIVPPGGHKPSGRFGEAMVDEKLNPKDLKYTVDGKLYDYEGMKTAVNPPKAQAELTAQDKILSHIVHEKNTTKLPSLNELLTSYVDRLHPLKETEKAAMISGGVEELPMEKRPYTLERLTAGTYGKALHFMKYATVDARTYDETGKSYEAVLKPASKDMDRFEAYMASRRAIELSERGAPGTKEEVQTGFDIDAARTVVKEGKQKYEKMFQEHLQYESRLNAYLQQSGILNEKTRLDMEALNTAHVPFYRAFEEQTRPTSAKSVRNPIHRQTGSERKIYSPVDSTVKNTFLFLSLAEKNMARQALVALGPEFAEKIPQPIRPIKLTEPEIQKLFDEFLSFSKKTATEKTETTTRTPGEEGATSKSGKLIRTRVEEALSARGFQEGEVEQMLNRLSAKGASAATVTTLITEINTTEYVPSIDIRLPNDIATIFRADAVLPGSDRLVVYHEGKREVYKVNPRVAEAFNQTDRVSASFLASMLNLPAKWLRAGTVISPDFSPRNLIRDGVSAFVYAVSNPVRTVKGGVSLLTKSPEFQDWITHKMAEESILPDSAKARILKATDPTAYKNLLKGGGLNATLVAVDRDYIGQELIDLNNKTGLMQRSWNIVSSPLRVLQVTTELFENSTRLGAVYDKMTAAKTKAQIQALSMIARNATVDFSVHGGDEFFQKWTHATAFMNPTIQGTRQLIEALKADPVGVSARAFTAITLPTLYLWWANHDDPRYGDINDWEKRMFHVILTKDHIYRIPKDFGLGMLFSTVPEMLLDAFVAEHPDAGKGLLDGLINAFSPNIVPTAVAPVGEQFSNRSLFTGNPVIPAHLEKLLPEYQYTEYTTEAAKALGALLGAFPGMRRASLDDKDPFIGGVARALTSPILIENYVRSWTGGTGMYVLKIADKMLREAGVLPDPVLPTRTLADNPFVKAFVVRYPSSSSQRIQDFFDHYYQKKKVYDSLNAMDTLMDADAHQKLMAFDPSVMLQLDGIRETLTQQVSVVHMINKNPQMPPDEKRQLIDSLYATMNELAKGGNTMLRTIEKGAP